MSIPVFFFHKKNISHEIFLQRYVFKDHSHIINYEKIFTATKNHMPYYNYYNFMLYLPLVKSKLLLLYLYSPPILIYLIKL